MSWSVSAQGKPAEVAESLDKQFAYPLADGSSGLADEGEKKTVRLVSEMISQCLDTVGPERTVTVSAYGHMGFSNWDTKENPGQNVIISISSGV
jgi:hypothetical protein